MMREHKINQEKNLFIDGYYISESICDRMLAYYERTPGKFVGKLGPGKVQKKLKDSTDLLVTQEEAQRDFAVRDYFKELQKACLQWQNKYKIPRDHYGPWGIVAPMNIQHYKPGGGYFILHNERDMYAHGQRMLTFMTYLNTVNDGGETEWPIQGVKIKPEKGLTVFWPTDWTHMHKGIVSTTEHKYITTGWYQFKYEDLVKQFGDVETKYIDD
tara:strand:+ start:631 stop:1272 length:642 start_codon:yes stop_codon:yes gene_type:complete